MDHAAAESDYPVITVKTELSKFLDNVVDLVKILILLAFFNGNEAGLDIPYDELLLEGIEIISADLSVRDNGDLNALFAYVFVVILLQDITRNKFVSDSAAGKAITASVTF